MFNFFGKKNTDTTTNNAPTADEIDTYNRSFGDARRSDGKRDGYNNGNTSYYGSDADTTSYEIKRDYNYFG